MKQFNSLQPKEQQDILNKALEFYKKHKEHVSKILDKEHNVAPSGSDLNHPELWKGCHWSWFLSNL